MEREREREARDKQIVCTSEMISVLLLGPDETLIINKGIWQHMMITEIFL